MMSQTPQLAEICKNITILFHFYIKVDVCSILIPDLFFIANFT